MGLHHGLSWRGWLLTAGYSSSLSLQFHLHNTKITNTNTSVSLLPVTTYLHIVVAPAAGEFCGLWWSGCPPLSELLGVVASGSLGVYSSVGIWLDSKYLPPPTLCCLAVGMPQNVCSLPGPCGNRMVLLSSFSNSSCWDFIFTSFPMNISLLCGIFCSRI